jgi:hypothetical protein
MFDASTQKPAYHDQKPQRQTRCTTTKSKEEDMSVLWKDWTCGESIAIRREMI